jgi:hypothetical protein
MSRAVVTWSGRQAGGVAEGGARHAEVAGAQRHHLREALPPTRRCRSPTAAGDVVGGAGDEGEDRLLDRDGVARGHAELGGRARRRLLRHRDARIEAESRPLAHLLEHHVERHHLGERGRMAGLVGARRDQTLPVRLSSTMAE